MSSITTLHICDLSWAQVHSSDNSCDLTIRAFALFAVTLCILEWENEVLMTPPDTLGVAIVRMPSYS